MEGYKFSIIKSRKKAVLLINSVGEIEQKLSTYTPHRQHIQAHITILDHILLSWITMTVC